MNLHNAKVDGAPLFFDAKRRDRSKSCNILFLVVLSLIATAALIFSLYTHACLKQLENEMGKYRSQTERFIKLIEDEFEFEPIDDFENEENFQEEIGETPSTEGPLIYYDEYESFEANDNKVEESRLADYADDNKIMTVLLPARKKRNVVAATEDGVLINSESYADIKRKNITGRLQEVRVQQVPAQQSVYGNLPTTSPAPTVYTRQSRVMQADPIRKPMLRSFDSSTEYNSEGHSTRGRSRYPYRQMGRMRLLPSIRLDGDTSKYVYGQHHNYNGNGHLSHPSQTYVDWKVKNWVGSSGMDQHFGVNDNGEITIKESGLYLIYAQIYYLDEHDMNGYRVYRNGGENLLQCTLSAHTQERKTKGNTCYTSGVDYLAEDDILTVADLFNGRYSLFEPGKSFFGVTKLGDMKIK